MSTFVVPTGELVRKLVHKDTWFKQLEKRIHTDLCQLPGRGAPPPINEMVAFAASNPKYARSCLFVTFENGRCQIKLPTPQRNERGVTSIDSRVHTYVRMLQDLAQWCTGHDLTLPETSFAIYCCDTYAWEPEACNFPWFVMAKPINRQGILIPDDSFVTHGATGTVPVATLPPGPASWKWGEALSQCKKIKGNTSGTVPAFFFRGSNTGSTKWDTRGIMASATEHDDEISICLERGNREPWTTWSKYGALLDLPGNQPWSYRRKYLHLLGRPIVQMDVHRFASAQDENGTDRWIQFFDNLLVAHKHYAPFFVDYVDDESPKMPNVSGIKATALHVSCPNKLSSKFSGRRVMSRMTVSHVLQYLYMTIWHYKLYFN